MTFQRLKKDLIEQKEICNNECHKAFTIKTITIGEKMRYTLGLIYSYLDKFANAEGEINGVKHLKEKLEQMKQENYYHYTNCKPNSVTQWELKGELYAINFALDRVNEILLDAEEEEK